MACRLLDLIQQEVDPFYLPTQKKYPGTKHEVGRMTRCWDVAIWNFLWWRSAAILDFIETEIAASIHQPW